MAYGVTPASASIGFLIGLGSQGLLLPTVAALLVGGLIAAPVAAWLVRVVPPRWPAVGVAGRGLTQDLGSGL